MSSNEYCPISSLKTGLDDINEVQDRIQDITTYTIFSTLLLAQCIISLILLPIPRIRKLIIAIDITPTIKSFEDENKEAKRLSGGVATIIITTAAIILTIVAFNTNYFASGTIVGIQNDVDFEEERYFNKPDVSIGLASKYTESASDVAVVYLETCGEYPSSAACNFAKPTSGLSIQLKRLEDSCDYYATICTRGFKPTSSTPDTVSLYAPITPSLSAYPPAGVFGDTIQKVTLKSRVTTNGDNVTVPVFSADVTLVKMINSQALAFLSLSYTPRWQMHINPPQSETRDVNSTANPNKQLRWPECDSIISITDPRPFKAAYSFKFHYERRNLNTKTVTIEEYSFATWILTTVLTIGSTVALQPSIRSAIIKLTDYWKNKAWVQWIVFLLVVFIGPLIMASTFTAVNNEIFLINGLFILPLLIAITYHHVKFASR